MDNTATKKRRASPAEVLAERIASAVYEKCRLKEFEIPGFPDFTPLVSELSEASSVTAVTDGFKVTSAHPSGNLIIQEQFFQQFSGEDCPHEEFEALVAEHNKVYNPDNVRVTEKPSPSPKATEDGKMELVAPEDGQQLTPEKMASLPNASTSQFCETSNLN